MRGALCCGCVCFNGLFLTTFQSGSLRVSLRGLSRITTSGSPPPELVSKLLEPWESQDDRVDALVSELVGEVRSGKKVVLLSSQPVRHAVGAPQRATRRSGGRVASGSSLVPLEVIKAKAAMNVEDADLDELDENSHFGRRRNEDSGIYVDDPIFVDNTEHGSLLAGAKVTPTSPVGAVEAISLFKNSIAILRHDLVQDSPLEGFLSRTPPKWTE